MPVGDTTGTSSNPSRNTSWDFASRHLRGGIWAADGCPADRHGACKTEPPGMPSAARFSSLWTAGRVSGLGPSTLMCPIPVTHTHTHTHTHTRFSGPVLCNLSQSVSAFFVVGRDVK